MTNYTAADNWATPQIPDTSDLVKGGTGISNNSSVLQEQMADRTQYLYNRLGGYIDVADVTGNATIDVTYANKLISVVKSGADVTLTLDALSNFKKGARLCFVAKLTGTGPYWLNIVTAENVMDGNTTTTSIYLYDGEMIELVAGASVWHWAEKRGNFNKIGEVELKRFQPRNSFLGDGTNGLVRARFPRLIAAVSSSFVTDTNWLSDPFRYRSQFSDGNGTTTFRSADYRGLFFRALDGGRGADLGRLDAVAGGYEPDAMKDFNASITGKTIALTGGNSGVPNADVLDSDIIAPFNGGNKAISKAFTVSGSALEVRPKSTAFNPYIFY